MSDENIHREEFGFEIDAPVITYGKVCDCGYTPIGKHDNKRISRWKCKLKTIAHKIRHPFKERTDFKEHIAEIGPKPRPTNPTPLSYSSDILFDFDIESDLNTDRERTDG